MNSLSTFCDNPGILQRDMLNTIILKGLSLERRLYLHDNICEFYPEQVQNLVCPKAVETP